MRQRRQPRFKRRFWKKAFSAYARQAIFGIRQFEHYIDEYFVIIIVHRQYIEKDTMLMLMQVVSMPLSIAIVIVIIVRILLVCLFTIFS